VRAPQALVVQPVRPAPWGASLAELRDAVFDALLYKKHPQLYREDHRATPPWDDAPRRPLLLRCSPWRWARALSRWPGRRLAGLTARLCARRLRGTARTPPHVADVVVTSALMPPLAVYWRLAGAIRYRVRFT
jgi:hypothetical protein